MEIGVTVRNMGPQAATRLLGRCALLAEQFEFESIWITDHIAIPPDDAEGSGGRYLDTLTTLAWLAGVTQSIKLGAGVLILPYRAKLPTAKQIATVQELSGERLLLGVGIGWMDAEFRALGIDRHQRGRLSDEALSFINRCFVQDVVTENDQSFIFAPRPSIPSIYVGGRAPHALKRAVRHGVGWLPMVRQPDQLSADLTAFNRLAAESERGVLPTTIMTNLLPAGDVQLGKSWLQQYQELGVERVVSSITYATADEYAAQLDRLSELREAIF